MAFTTRELIKIYTVLDIIAPTDGTGNQDLRVMDSTMRGSILITGEMTTGTPPNVRAYIATRIETNIELESYVRELLAEWEDVESVTARMSGPNSAVGALGGVSWDPNVQRDWIQKRLLTVIPYMRREKFFRQDNNGSRAVSQSTTR